ncbi:hypothetical protein NFJ02_34g85570 [Pycnococcus provasolii]
MFAKKSGNNHQPRDEHDYELERIAARAIPFEVNLAPAISQAELEQLRRMQAATVLGPSAVAGAAGGWPRRHAAWLNPRVFDPLFTATVQAANSLFHPPRIRTKRFARPYNYSDPQDNDPCARAGRLFCHDPFVAVALVVVPVFFVYSIVALNTDVPSTCPSNVKGAATGWLPGIVLMYIMLSGAIIGLSLCCMSCSQTTTGTHTTYGHHYPATMRGYGNNNNNNSSNIGTNSRFALFGPVGGVLSYLFVPPQRQQPPTTMRQSTAPPMHVPPPVVPAPQYPQPRAPPAQPTMYAGGGYGAPPPPPHPPQQQQPTAPVTGYPVGHGGGGYAPSAPSASSFPATGGGQPYSSAPPPPPPQQQQPSAAAQIAGAAASGIASMAAAGLRTAAAGLERASQRPSQAQAQGQGQAPARPTYR